MKGLGPGAPRSLSWANFPEFLAPLKKMFQNNPKSQNLKGLGPGALGSPWGSLGSPGGSLGLSSGHPQGPRRDPWEGPWGGALRAPGRRQTRTGNHRGSHACRLPGPCVRSTLRTFFPGKRVDAGFSFSSRPKALVEPGAGQPGGGLLLSYPLRFLAPWGAYPRTLQAPGAQGGA